MAFCDNPECLKCLNKDPIHWSYKKTTGERREPRSVGKVELGLVDRIGKLETALVARIARLEVATEGFINPQSTPQ